MKHFTFVFALLMSLSSRSQDMAKQMQKHMWYIKGDLYRGDLCKLYSEKIENTSGYLLFGKDELSVEQGNTGERFACSYEFLNNKIKLFYSIKYLAKDKVLEPKQVTLYYRIEEIFFAKEYLLTPITSVDFK